MLVGLLDKMKGAFGGDNDNGDEPKSAYEQYGEDIERESKADDFREKAEGRDRMQQEYEDLLREAKEKQARQEEPPPVQRVATETVELEPEPEPIRPKTASELRNERIEELRQRGKLSELESKYTRTGQLKTELKGAAKETFFGPKKGTAIDRDGRERVGRSGAADRATKAIRGVATLGGAVHISKARKHLYTPKVDLDYYVPGKKRIAKGATEMYTAPGMKELHVPKPAGAMQTGTLRRASTPSYERMRQASTFKPRQTTTPATASPLMRAATGASTHLAKPMGFVKVGSQAQDVAMERLRGLSFPTGLTNTEKLAYAEIKANHDIDTKSHVVSELMDLGIDKMEALRAVEGLMQRRVVKRGQTFAGEPALEIT